MLRLQFILRVAALLLIFGAVAAARFDTEPFDLIPYLEAHDFHLTH
jgi:hypothetical protein